MQAAFNFKSTRLDALLVQPQSNDAAALAAQWQQQADKYRTFAAMPLVLDLDALADAEKLDIAAVCALFKEHGFTPVALRHSKRDWEKTAAANNLLFVAADKAKAKEQARQPENGRPWCSRLPESGGGRTDAAPNAALWARSATHRPYSRNVCRTI